MKNNILHLLLLLTILFLSSVSAKNAKDRIVHRDIVFKIVKNDTLKYDLYEPSQIKDGDKPLLVFFHGGGFHGGEKEDPKIVELCSRLADSGYVTAAVEYRTGIERYSEKNFFKALMIGVYDGGDFLNHITSKSKLYHIDRDQIFVGGISSGAVVALHLAYLDLKEAKQYMKQQDINLFLPKRLDTFPKIAGVLNCWGLILDPSILSNNNIPIVTLHGDKDRIVPFKKGKPMHIPWLPTVYGGYTIHNAAKKYNITSLFHFYKGMKHGHLENTPRMDTTFSYINNFVQKIYQNQQHELSLLVHKDQNTELNIRKKIFPNSDITTMLSK